MKFHTHKIAVLALVALLVASAGTAAAALTYDNETTDSTSTSDLVGGETVTDLDATNQSKTIQVISDNASSSGLTNPEEAFTLKMTVNDANNRDNGYTFYTNDSASWTVVNASAGHYSINLTHAAMFDELPRAVNENVTVDVTVIFNETETDEEKSTISITAQNDAKRAVDVITDADVDDEDDVELVEEERTLRGDLDYAALDAEEDLASGTTHVSYVLANKSVSDKYEEAYDVGSFDKGDYIFTMTAFVGGEPIMIFSDEKGDDVDAGVFSGGFDGDDDSYAVYHLNGGDHGEHAQIDVYPGDDADDDELEFESAGNKKLGFWANFKNFGYDAAKASGFGISPDGDSDE